MAQPGPAPGFARLRHPAFFPGGRHPALSGNLSNRFSKPPGVFPTLKSSPTIVNLADAYFPDQPGGAARLAYQLCQQQRQWGYRVFLVCTQDRPERPTREVSEEITIFRCPPSRYRSPHPLNLLDKIRHARVAVERIAAETGAVDVIHSHTPLLGTGAMQAKTRSRTRKIHSIHSPWLLEMRVGKSWEGRGSWKQALFSRIAFLAAKRLEARCFSLADVLTAFSNFTRQEVFLEQAPVVRGKPFPVLPGWVDVGRFSPDGPRTDWEPELARPAKAPVFLTLRAFLPRNGLLMLLEAAALVKAQNPNFELLIGGDGYLRPDLQAKIKALDLQDRVTLLGRVPDDRLPVLYRSCDVFVLPTLALECFGIIILEALASGKPIIATPVGAIPELMRPIYPQGLLPETSAPALAQAMLKFIQNFQAGNQIEDHRKSFQSFVTQGYSLAIGTGRFKELYEAPLPAPCPALRDRKAMTPCAE